MPSNYIPSGKNEVIKRQMRAAYASGKKVGSRKASVTTIENDLLMIYSTFIIALHERGWSSDDIEEMLNCIQNTAARLFEEGYGYHDFVNKAEELTGIVLKFTKGENDER